MARTRRRSIFLMGYKDYMELKALQTICNDKAISTTTIDELKQILKTTFSLLFMPINLDQPEDLNTTLKNRFEIIEKDTDGKIEIKLKEINLLSSYKEKEQQLVRLLLEYFVDILWHYKLYYEYLVFTNGDFVEPVYNTNDTYDICYKYSLFQYTNHFFSLKGLEILLNMDSTPKFITRGQNKVDSPKKQIPKEQFLKFIELYFNQDKIDFGNILSDLLVFIITGDVICDHDENELMCMTSLFYKINDFTLNFHEILQQSFNIVYIDNNNLCNSYSDKSKMLLIKYRWIIKYLYLNININPVKYNSLDSICIDCKELVDFIFENKNIYKLIPGGKKIHQLNFKSFEIASYFENQLNQLYKLSSDDVVTVMEKAILKESIYKKLFNNSIKECDVDTLNSIQSSFKSTDNDEHNGFSKIKIKRLDSFGVTELQETRSTIYSNELLRNKFIDHLNNTSFNCFSIDEFKMFISLLKPPITESNEEQQQLQTDHDIICNFNFISNPILSTELLLDSIFELDFKMVKSILYNDKFQLSKPTMIGFIRDPYEYYYNINEETFISKFNFKDIKDLINYLFLKLSTSDDEIKKFTSYIFKHLYKCLIQSKGINSLSDLIEIHQLYEQYQLQSVFQDKELFNIIYWANIKSKKFIKFLGFKDYFMLPNLLSSFSYCKDLDREYKSLLGSDKLSFDFILNCNNFKDLFLILTEIKPSLKSIHGDENDNDDNDGDEEKERDHYRGFYQELLDVGEIRLFLELFSKIENKETKYLPSRAFASAIFDGGLIKEFLDLDLVGYGITWAIEQAIGEDRFDIIEYLLDKFNEETLESITDELNFGTFFDYSNPEFTEYLFKNHLELVLKYYKEEVEDVDLDGEVLKKRKRSRSAKTYMKTALSGGVDVCDLYLKFAPQIFTFDQDFIDDMYDRDNFELINYYFETGHIKLTDISLNLKEELKCHMDYQHFEWVKNL